MANFQILMRSTGRVTPKGFFIYEITSKLSTEQLETLTKMNNGFSLEYREKLYWNLPIHPTDPADLSTAYPFNVSPDYIWKNGKIGAIFFDKNYAARLASYEKLKQVSAEVSEESEF